MNFSENSDEYYDFSDRNNMLIGHKRIWDFLIQSAKKERLSHAYLFGGAAQLGKKTLAIEFVKWLLCRDKKGDSACGRCRSCFDIEKKQHPDVFFLSPSQEEKKGVTKTHEIGIDDIKALQHQLSLFPFSAKYKIAIIDEASMMSREAANSFLKTLEEPGKNTLIFLIASNWQNIPETIVSRCQFVKFLPVAEKEIIEGLKKTKKLQPQVSLIARVSVNRPGRAMDLLENPEFLSRQEKIISDFKKTIKSDLVRRWDLAKELSQNGSLAQETLSQWLVWLRDRALQNIGCEELIINGLEAEKYQLEKITQIIREIQKTHQILDNSSFNSRLALEVLLLKI